MNTLTVQPQDDGTLAAIQHEGNRAYDAAIASGNESAYDAYRDTTTNLTEKVKIGELWLCPACCKVLAPINTLCVYCEGEEHDHDDDREAQTAMRYGG